MLEDEKIVDTHVIVRLGRLGPAYQKPVWQVFFAKGGFGCTPGAMSLGGGTVFGRYVHDDSEGSIKRNDIERLATQDEIDAAKAPCQCEGSKHN